MAHVRIVGKRRSNERCVICHGALRESVTACRGCGATMHADCREDHGRCPTIGCSELATASTARARAARREAESLEQRRGPPPGLGARLGPYTRLLKSGLFSAVFAGMASAFLAWPLLSWSSFWALMRHDGESNTDSTARGLIYTVMGVGFALVVAGFSWRWLFRIPSVFREVRQLLDGTTPVPMRVTIRVTGSGSDEKRVAVLEGSGQDLELPLEGLLPPAWLLQLPGGSRCYVYGLPPPGPYLIEMPDGRLALVHPD